MGQSVEFKKRPSLGALELNKLINVSEKDLTDKLSPIYKLLLILKNNDLKAEI